jgi:hypothetical protein
MPLFGRNLLLLVMVGALVKSARAVHSSRRTRGLHGVDFTLPIQFLSIIREIQFINPLQPVVNTLRYFNTMKLPILSTQTVSSVWFSCSRSVPCEVGTHVT